MLPKEQEEIHQMIQQYVESIGLKKKDTFNPDTGTWEWMTGSAHIQVYTETIRLSDKHQRDYICIYSPIMEIPETKKQELFQHLLELNSSLPGVKFTLLRDDNKVYAAHERDIKGMDYQELYTFIADLEWYADQYDDELIDRFAS